VREEEGLVGGRSWSATLLATRVGDLAATAVAERCHNSGEEPRRGALGVGGRRLGGERSGVLATHVGGRSGSDTMAVVPERRSKTATGRATCMRAWRKRRWRRSFGLVVACEHRAAMAMAMVSLVWRMEATVIVACSCAVVLLRRRRRILLECRHRSLLACHRRSQLDAVVSFTPAGAGGKRGPAWHGQR
jgi:hypothetical protein